MPSLSNGIFAFPQVSLPEAQIACAPTFSLAWPPSPPEPVQLQLVPISRAAGALSPVTYSHLTQLVTFPVERNPSLRGRRPGQPWACPPEKCWFGAVPRPSVSGQEAPKFLVLSLWQSQQGPAGLSVLLRPQTAGAALLLVHSCFQEGLPGLLCPPPLDPLSPPS